MSENKFEFPGGEPEQAEKELNPEEREQLKGEMDEYITGLKTRIDEVRTELMNKPDGKGKKELEEELAELEEEAAGLGEFAGEINEAESIKIKPYEGGTK